MTAAARKAAYLTTTRANDARKAAARRHASLLDDMDDAQAARRTIRARLDKIDSALPAIYAALGEFTTQLETLTLQLDTIRDETLAASQFDATLTEQGDWQDWHDWRNDLNDHEAFTDPDEPARPRVASHAAPLGPHDAAAAAERKASSQQADERERMFTANAALAKDNAALTAEGDRLRNLVAFHERQHDFAAAVGYIIGRIDAAAPLRSADIACTIDDTDYTASEIATLWWREQISTPEAFHDATWSALCKLLP